MKKIIILLSALISFISCSKKLEISKENTNPKGNIYSFNVYDIDGNSFDMNSLKGKKVMIVNTASKCGFTHQYKQLEEVYSNYKDRNFTIIGFPANNFMSQEPGNNKEIKTFCTENYGVSFPMMSKISVKGKDIHPLYQYLTQKNQNGVIDNEVKWNFQKYLINEDGHISKIYYSKTKPNDPEIISWIEGEIKN